MRMRSAHIVDKHCIVCEQVNVLEPEAGEVLVRTSWAAICGSDTHMLHSELPWPRERLARPGFPGHEGIGYVEASRHPDYRAGDLVLTLPEYESRTGTFCDYQTLSSGNMLPIPTTDLPLEQLMMTQQFGTTIFSLRQLPVDLVGKTAMVLGQGSAGLFFAWNLKRLGAGTVIASDKSDARLAISRQFGVDVPVKAGEPAREAVMDHTAGKGVDFLVEAVGSGEALAQSIGLIREDGHGLYYGLPDTQALVPFNFHDFQRRRITIKATSRAMRDTSLVSFKLALRLVLEREIDMSPLISHTFRLDDIEAAMDHAATYKDNARKVCIKF